MTLYPPPPPPPPRQPKPDTAPMRPRDMTTITRKQLSTTLDGIRSMMEANGKLDMAQFYARLHEVDMIEMLAGMALDPGTPRSLRRECANDVLDRARGKPVIATKRESVAPPKDGDPLVSEIETATQSARQMLEMQRWLGRPVGEWPAEVRARFPQVTED